MTTDAADSSADRHRGQLEFPVVPAAALKATLGILARTVEQGV